MDWPFFKYLTFLAKEGWPALLALTATVPTLAFAGLPKRKFLACAPGVLALLAFVSSCYIASLPITDASVPFAGLLLTVLLVVPSVLALRFKWLGLLHVLTVTAAFYLYLICSLAISGDAP